MKKLERAGDSSQLFTSDAERGITVDSFAIISYKRFHFKVA